MVIDDERGISYDMDDFGIVESSIAATTVTPEAPMGFPTIFECETAIHIRSAHDQLQNYYNGAYFDICTMRHIFFIFQVSFICFVHCVIFIFTK
jgi:hypothetical protein